MQARPATQPTENNISPKAKTELQNHSFCEGNPAFFPMTSPACLCASPILNTDCQDGQLLTGPCFTDATQSNVSHLFPSLSLAPFNTSPTLQKDLYLAGCSTGPLLPCSLLCCIKLTNPSMITVVFSQPFSVTRL